MKTIKDLKNYVKHNSRIVLKDCIDTRFFNYSDYQLIESFIRFLPQSQLEELKDLKKEDAYKAFKEVITSKKENKKGDLKK